MRKQAIVVCGLGTAFVLQCVSAWAAVGRTPASFEVSNTGEATYSIPLKLPHGAGGLTPHIGLSYSSGAGNGLAGIGFNISGLSAIARCDKTLAQDGNPAPATLEVTDVFCLNGNRLRLTGGTYGATGSTYQLEVEDFTRLTAYGTAGAGPQYFVAYGADGLIYEYGNTTDSRIEPLAVGGGQVSTVAIWALNKISDRFGNAISFSYQEDTTNGGFRPDEISWAANSGQGISAPYKIKFVYESSPRPDAVVAYRFGDPSTVDGERSEVMRLDRIDIIKNSTAGIIRRYEVSYDSGGAGGQSRVTSVQECGVGASDCFPATTFTYTSGTAGTASETYTGYSMPQPPAVLDINGDGRDDLIWATANTSTATLVYALSTGSGYAAPVSTSLPSRTNNSFLYKFVDTLFFDQDKFEDVLHPCAGGVWSTTWCVTKGSATGLQTGATINTGISINDATATWSTADINGDGLMDLVQITDLGTNSVPIKVYLSNGSAFGSPITIATFSEPAATHVAPNIGAVDPKGRFKTLKRHRDYNGDGIEDVELTFAVAFYDEETGGSFGYLLTCLITDADDFDAAVSCGGDWSTYVVAGDFNGDGNADRVDVTGYYYYAYISRGAGGFEIAGASQGNPIGAVMVMDWNGDSLDDIVGVNSSTNTIWVGLSTGGWVAAPVNTGISASYMDRWAIADVNGDHLADIIHSPSDTVLRFGLHAGGVPDLLDTVTDGNGNTINVDYISSVNGNYTPGNSVYTSTRERDTNEARIVVSQVTHPDGIGGTYAQTYQYGPGREDLDGRGFLGFASIQITDNRSAAPTVLREFNTGFPLTGTVYRERVFQHGTSTRISDVSSTYSAAIAGSGSTARHYVKLDGSFEEKFEVGGAYNGYSVSTVARTFSYNSTGSPYNVITPYSSIETATDTFSASPFVGQTHTVSTTLTISPDTYNWCLDKPTHVVTALAGTGETSVTRTVDYSVNYGTCRVTQEDFEPSSSNRRVIRSIGYDGFGNVNSVSTTGRTSSGAAMSARTESATWGSGGRYPASVTNALSQTNTLTHNDDFGILATATDPNGIVVVSSTYDSFGRFLRTTRADGTSTVHEYFSCAAQGWCENGDPGSGLTGVNKLVVRVSERDTSDSWTRYNYQYFDLFDRPIIRLELAHAGAGWNRTGRQYDEMGRVYRETAPCTSGSCSLYWTTNTYDPLGRITQQSRPTSQSVSTPVTTTFAYAGGIQTVTDPQSKVTTKILDVNGRMRRSQDHNGYYQSFGYDAAGSLNVVTDSLSNTLFTASYSYGIKAFRDSTTDMDLGTWTYSYNSLGELTNWYDAKGQGITQAYDALSRATYRNEAEGATYWNWGTSAGSYNIGRLASVSMPGYSESYTFDNKGRLSTRTVGADQTYTIDYAYNNQGLLDTLTYPTSTSSTRAKVKYGYSYGILSSVTDWTSGSAGTAYWTANAKNPRGQTTQETLGNGVVTNRAIDAVTGWTSSIQSGVSGGAGLQNHSYLYDLVGNVTQRQEGNLGLTENFYYDNLYRLDYSQLNGSTNLDLTYDAMGNITARSDVNGGASWTYHSTKKHAVATTGSGGYSYNYDANGNMTSRNGSTISWASYNYPTGLVATGSESTTIYYDPNRQYYKQVYSGPSGTETTHYIGGILEKVALPSGTTDWRHYITAERQTVAVVSRSSSGTNSVSYPLEDHQGSASVLTNSSGGSIVKESFNAYGLPRSGSTWSGSVPSGDKTAINGLTRRGYTFHSMLGDMGLIHMNGRVQDAITGRFLSPDPTIPNPGFTQSYNRYSYVLNNPLRFIDPSGFAEGELPPGCYVEVGKHDPRCDNDDMEEQVVRGWRSIVGSYSAEQFILLNSPSQAWQAPAPPLEEFVVVGERESPQGQNRSHSYEVRNEICSLRDRVCSVESVYAALRRHPAPGMGRNTQGVVDGQISIAQLGYDANWDDLGPVRHTVLESQLTVINSTVPGHRLHQGDVVRQVYVDGGSVWIGTTGTGTGPYPGLNERLSNPLWSAVDSTIRYDINLGYRP